MRNYTNKQNYKKLLKHYINTKNRPPFNQLRQMSQSFKASSLFPEDIVSLHNEAVFELWPGLTREQQKSMDFLLQTMVLYGAEKQNYETIINEQRELKSEIEIAASMQKIILETTIPVIDDLDIGAISVPAEQMNGDYYQFFTGEDGTLGVAVADVIGKGVPAALCMSMIKYSMDSFSVEATDPSVTLRNINRVVNRNIDSSMFVTMFYAQYFPDQHKLQYASGGHEPGFYYNAKENTFHEIETEGLVLGVFPDSTYKQYEQNLAKGDMVILLTDGVTECRVGGRFIEQDELLTVIRKYADLNAQDHVNEVYNYFKTKKNSHFKDDFTLIILKRSV